jgi:hypothetical protein
VRQQRAALELEAGRQQLVLHAERLRLGVGGGGRGGRRCLRRAVPVVGRGGRHPWPRAPAPRWRPQLRLRPGPLRPGTNPPAPASTPAAWRAGLGLARRLCRLEHPPSPPLPSPPLPSPPPTVPAHAAPRAPGAPP